MLWLNSFNCGLDPMDKLKKKQKCGADAHAQIKRSDFGMKYAIPAAGDDVKLAFEIEAVKN